MEEEISLDNFFQLAGVDSTQIESICGGPSVEDDQSSNNNQGDSYWSKSQLVVHSAAQSFGSGDSKLFIKQQYEQEIANYKKKLSNYYEGQQKQAQLIQKLQTKVS